MKFSILAIAGALVSAKAAVIRGDVAAQKLAVMQRLTDAANKKAFGVVNRHLEENQDNQNNEEEATSETVLQPNTCITAAVYNGDDDSGFANMATTSYLTFSSAAKTYDENGDAIQSGSNSMYVTTLSGYLSIIGQAWAEERRTICDDCETMEEVGVCDMSDKEKEFFSSMSQAEFEEYIVNVYAAYNGQDNQEGNGNRHLYGYALCSTCDEKCVDDENERQQQEFYEELEKLFEEEMCVEADNGSGYYIGHTCGNNGRSIELAFFEDDDCKHLAPNQNAYEFYENAVTQYFFYENANDAQNGDAQEEYNFDPKDLGNAYMSMIVEMYNREFSCTVGAEREGGDNDPSESCETLFKESISSSECESNNQNYENQNNENTNLPDGYDFAYSDNIQDTCAAIFQLESKLLSNSGTNPYTGKSFVQTGKSRSVGAKIGIAILVIAVVAVVVIAALNVINMVIKKMKKKKNLEEPIMQGGALS